MSEVSSSARTWLAQKEADSKSKTYTSKFYLPEESWPKVSVWWLQVPVSVAESEEYDFVNFVCQKFSNADDFYHLKVPCKYLRENSVYFDVVGSSYSIYLDADPENKFVEIRGKGKIDFKFFLV